MAVYDFFLSRNSKPTAANYVGHKGRMFYDADEKVLRISDGSTPGGFPVTPTTLVSTTEPTIVTEGQMWYNPTTLELWCYHNGAFEPTIDLATSTKIGGVKLGPGVVTNGQGQIVIDSTGLDFRFGDFYAFTNPGAHDGACLSSINANQDVNLISNGTGKVNVVGEFHIHPTNSTVEDALATEAIFSINSTGDIRVLAPNTSGLTGAIQLVGNSTGATVSPNQTGVVLHITGNQDIVSRNYFDGSNNYPLLTGRRYNGTPGTPTQVLSGELFFRIAGQAYTSSGFQTFGPCQIDWVATENQGPNNQGGELRIRATPNGSSAIAGITQVASFNASTGVTAIKFNGPLTGDVTGNVSGNAGTATTATNLAAATGILAGTITINPASVAGASDSTQTFTLTGLTTDHKIVITSGTAVTGGLIITGAWASALNTVSIAFRNTNNQAVDSGNLTIQYLAWI